MSDKLEKDMIIGLSDDTEVKIVGHSEKLNHIENKLYMNLANKYLVVRMTFVIAKSGVSGFSSAELPEETKRTVFHIPDKDVAGLEMKPLTSVLTIVMK